MEIPTQYHFHDNKHPNCFNETTTFIFPSNQAKKYLEIKHFNHPQHKIKFEYTQVPFKCDGCKEVGIGSHYKCNFTCDYDLHMHCALFSPTFSHPFYPECTFQFYPRPPGAIRRYCNACERGISGFSYHCKSCGFDLHPCCAKLPTMIDDGEIKLYLHRKVSDACHRCGKKGRSWSYRSTGKEYNLHVACVREMLVENWYEIYNDKGGENRGNLGNRIPTLKNSLQTHHKKGKGKARKCCEVAGLAMQFVVSAVLGDPTTLIAGVVGSLMSR